MAPKRIFFTKGVGRHRQKLASFEAALRDAGIEKFNLVYVSSIFPPSCKIITKEEGLKFIHPGEIVYCVMARQETNEHNRLIASSIGVAIPSDESQYGYLSEHHSNGETDERAGDYAEDLAASMLATTLGIEFDENMGWDEREQVYKMSGKIIRTRNITQSAEGKDGMWTTVLSAAVLLDANGNINNQ
ncbi:MAG TPA: arginine decarboxylase, pyruvoyl-dependent [Candidatus Nanoarchaeia archaeon]|nr:arginine decarboxylase, pyruvoyl-dependent [Candidatus Nanoarchaeia archaeon]